MAQQSDIQSPESDELSDRFGCSPCSLALHRFIFFTNRVTDLAWCVDYHQQVVEQEDFSLVDAAPLAPVWIRDLEQLTAANQSAMRQGEHLQHTKHDGVVPQRLRDPQTSAESWQNLTGFLPTTILSTA